MKISYKKSSDFLSIIKNIRGCNDVEGNTDSPV